MLQRFLNWRFWFSIKPEVLTQKMLWSLLGIFAFCLISAFALRFAIYLSRRDVILVKIFKKFYKFFLTVGLVGFVFLFFTYEQIVFLGSYFWFLFLFLGSLVWFVLIVFFLVKKIPKERKALEEKRRFEKYLP